MRSSFHAHLRALMDSYIAQRMFLGSCWVLPRLNLKRGSAGDCTVIVIKYWLREGVKQSLKLIGPLCGWTIGRGHMTPFHMELIAPCVFFYVAWLSMPHGKAHKTVFSRHDERLGKLSELLFFWVPRHGFLKPVVHAKPFSTCEN